jgi:hypothetical protein
MPRRSTVHLALIALFVFFFLFGPRASSQQSSDHFDLHGKVINALTGEAISGALVQLDFQHVQFTQSDGSFVFANLPRGQFAVQTRKPGFFSDAELGRNNLWISSEKALEGEIIVKLTPEGIIFGQLKNESDEPVEGASVRLQRWQVENGRKQLQIIAQTSTNDEGNFRLAELKPGSYFLSFALQDRVTQIVNGSRTDKEADVGYGAQFYPGTPDLAAATSLRVHSGAQLHLSQTFRTQHLFQISGAVRGAAPGSSFDISLVDSLGERLPMKVYFDSKTREFQILGMPAGKYMLVVTSFFSRNDPSGSGPPPLFAAFPITVNADLDGVILTLSTAIQLAVHLRDEIQPDASSNNFHQVSIQLIPKEFSQNAQSVAVPASPSEPALAASFEYLIPGIYTAEAFPNGGYVYEMRCGSVDLLREDLTVAPGSSPPPIEVILRGDGAKLTTALQGPGNLATFVVYSQEYPRRSLLMPIAYGETSASAANLPPGTYQVFALNDASDFEYRNPAAVAPYLKHATAITLQPGDNASIRVELQQSTEPQP